MDWVGRAARIAGGRWWVGGLPTLCQAGTFPGTRGGSSSAGSRPGRPRPGEDADPAGLPVAFSRATPKPPSDLPACAGLGRVLGALVPLRGSDFTSNTKGSGSCFDSHRQPPFVGSLFDLSFYVALSREVCEGLRPRPHAGLPGEAQVDVAVGPGLSCGTRVWFGGVTWESPRVWGLRPEQAVRVGETGRGRKACLQGLLPGESSWVSGCCRPLLTSLHCRQFKMQHSTLLAP